jgi:hypothetical protein
MAGSGADAEQEQKRAAAAAYDYEGDARWSDYWSNVLVPPNLASRPDVVDHFKRKFYQRYIVSSTDPLGACCRPYPSLSSPLLASIPRFLPLLLLFLEPFRPRSVLGSDALSVICTEVQSCFGCLSLLC